MSFAATTRGLITEALTETGNVISGSITDDGGGGATAVATIGGTIDCRIDSLRGDEGRAGDRISDRSTHLITVPAGTDVDTSDDFRVNGRGTFEVLAVREYTGEQARFIEAVSR